jgi:hypothetical protein
MKRGYNFNKKKINWSNGSDRLIVTKGQLRFEKSHLLNKLKIRDKNKYTELTREKILKTHPLFKVIDGETEEWEKYKKEIHT